MIDSFDEKEGEVAANFATGTAVECYCSIDVHQRRCVAMADDSVVGSAFDFGG